MIESSSKSGGIGFCGILTIAFIILKLIGEITWEWGWVLAPLWIPAAVGVAVVGIIAIVSALTKD